MIGTLKRLKPILRSVCILIILIPMNGYANNRNTMRLKLSTPSFRGSLKSSLEKRRSCRNFQKNKALSLDDLSTILWATYGKKYDALTGATRTAPSAGAVYPLELYLVVGQGGVNNLSSPKGEGKLKEGVYHYLIEEHSLELIAEGDRRPELVSACLGQSFISEAPVSVVITAQFQRINQRYGSRGERYAYMEAGHACQNTYLAVADLGLSTVEVGAFADKKVIQVLNLDQDSTPLSVMPIGYAQSWGK